VSAGWTVLDTSVPQYYAELAKKYPLVIQEQEADRKYLENRDLSALVKEMDEIRSNPEYLHQLDGWNNTPPYSKPAQDYLLILSPVGGACLVFGAHAWYLRRKNKLSEPLP
jgi:hypothetical protein